MRLLAIGLVATGCVYIDPINEQPRIMSVQRQCTAAVVALGLPCDPEFGDLHRGDPVTLAATFHDPDGNDAECKYQWRLFACGADNQCDPGAVYESTDQLPEVLIPTQLASTGGAVQLVHIDLDLFDNRGGRGSAARSVTINEGPSLGLRAQPGRYAIGGPIPLFATYGDPDGASASVRLDWTVTPPDGAAAYTLTDRAVTQNAGDPAHVTAGKTLVPGATGAWDVGVVATDAGGAPTEQHVTLHVDPDRAPCLAQWQPAVATAPASLPISAPTLFQVPLVEDDLDPYPAQLGAPLLGTTTFAWSLLRPGATKRQPLTGATGNSVALDPAAFSPGDVVELRVEIFDRTHTPVACPDADPTCAIAAPDCLQRQTWRVETR